MAITILLIHTYFGYFATGGPSGVGRGGRQRGAHLPDRGGLGDPAGVAGHLRLQRQLQPVGIGGLSDSVGGHDRNRVSGSVRRAAWRARVGSYARPLRLHVVAILDRRALGRVVPRQLHQNRSGDRDLRSRRPGDEPRRQGQDARRRGRQGRLDRDLAPTARRPCTWRWIPTQLTPHPAQRHRRHRLDRRCSAPSSSSSCRRRTRHRRGCTPGQVLRRRARHRRDQHRLPATDLGARQDRPGQAQRDARCDRQRRSTAAARSSARPLTDFDSAAGQARPEPAQPQARHRGRSRRWPTPTPTPRRI